MVPIQLPPISFLLLIVLCRAKNIWKLLHYSTSGIKKNKQTNTGSVHPLQPYHTQRQHRTGCFIFHVHIQFQEWKIQTVQLSTELCISTCIFPLLSKELGQAFVSFTNPTWAVATLWCTAYESPTVQFWEQ